MPAPPAPNIEKGFGRNIGSGRSIGISLFYAGYSLDNLTETHGTECRKPPPHTPLLQRSIRIRRFAAKAAESLVNRSLNETLTYRYADVRRPSRRGHS